MSFSLFALSFIRNCYIYGITLPVTFRVLCEFQLENGIFPDYELDLFVLGLTVKKLHLASCLISTCIKIIGRPHSFPSVSLTFQLSSKMKTILIKFH